MPHIYDMVIIGGGPAGYTAALYAVREGFDTIVIEKMSAGGQMALTGDIDNYPGFEMGVDGYTLGTKMQQGAERFGAKTEYADVRSVDFSEIIKKVETTDKTFFGKTVVIASGANPRELGIAKESEFIGKGVHYCAHCDGRFYKDKTVIVIGGGNSAAADALYLSHLAKKVYVVHRRDKLRASKIYHEPLSKTENVEFIWNSALTELITGERLDGETLSSKTADRKSTDNKSVDNKSADGKNLIGVKVKNTVTNKITEIMCDGVFVSIGRKPATDFLKTAVELDKNGYITADESTRTNIDGVFAAGDVRTKALRQIVTAVSDGATAVHYAEQYLAHNI